MVAGDFSGGGGRGVLCWENEVVSFSFCVRTVWHPFTVYVLKTRRPVVQVPVCSDLGRPPSAAMQEHLA